MTFGKRLTPLLLVGAICSVLDQYTKWLARTQLVDGEVHTYLGDTFRLQLAHNYGAFLSLGASLPEFWRQAIWTVGVGGVLTALLIYALIGKSVTRGMLWAFALILAGGANNLYDRIAYGGYVIDFMNAGIGPVRTGIFNIADIAIMAGAFVALGGAFFESRGAKPAAI
ncbi:MAG TPA: signal peptidase II [Steroidobacteraceae bacterium]|nr:signal peptidase II [Steroidobacteraceae bacterium]